MDPGPPCCREAGGCISAPSAFWGPSPFSLVHEYLPGSETFHLVLSFHELPLPPAPSSRALQGELSGNPPAIPLPRGSNLPRAHTRSSAWGSLSLPLPWVLPRTSGSIPPASHPKGPSLWLQPLMSRLFQLDLVIPPPTPHPTRLQLCGMSSPRFLFASQGLCPSPNPGPGCGCGGELGPVVITAEPFEVSSRNTRASPRWARCIKLKCRHPPLL